MRFDPQIELNLLRTLIAAEDSKGIFFVRWDEVRSRLYRQEYLDGIEGSPDLSPQSEFHLNEMEKRGFVEAHRNWDTKEGRQFSITVQGQAHLDSHENNEIAAALKAAPSKATKLLIGFFAAIVLAVATAWAVHYFGPSGVAFPTQAPNTLVEP